jgi:hypothetical protein
MLAIGIANDRDEVNGVLTPEQSLANEVSQQNARHGAWCCGWRRGNAQRADRFRSYANFLKILLDTIGE